MFTNTTTLRARLLPVVGVLSVTALTIASCALFISLASVASADNVITYLAAVEGPSAPENLRVRSVTGDSVTLDWNTPADNGTPIIGYSVRFHEQDSCASEFPVAIITHGTTYTFSGLSPDTTYSFEVRAHSDGLWGGFSECVSATTNVQVGTGDSNLVPTNVQAESFVFLDLGELGVDASLLSVVVNWELADTEAERVVAIYDNDQCLYPLQEERTTENGTLLLVPGGAATYFVNVRAEGNDGTAGVSDCVAVIALDDGDTSGLVAPTNLRIPAATHDSVSVAWDALSDDGDGVSYSLHLYEDETCRDSSAFDSVITKETEHTFSGLKPNTTYAFNVRVHRGDVWSDPSYCLATTTFDEPFVDSEGDEDEAGEGGDELVVAGELVLDVSEVTHDTVSLRWVGGDGIYQAVLFADPFCMYPLIREENARGQKHTFADLSQETSYSVRVQSVNEVGTVYTSSCESVVTERDLSQISKYPASPEGVTVVGTTFDSITLSWDEPESRYGIDKYHVHKYAGGQCSGGTLGFDIAMGPEAVILVAGGRAIEANTTYSFAVQARSNGLWGDFSNCVLAMTTDAQAPSTPENLREQKVTSTSIEMTWDKAKSNGSPITTYELRRYADSQCVDHYDVVKNDRILRSGTSYDLTPGSTHFFTIRAQNEVGWSALSPCVPATAVQDGVTGPTNVRFDTVTHNSFIVLWDSTDAMQQYRVSLYADTTCIYPTKSRKVTGTAYTFADLTPGSTYYVSVQPYGTISNKNSCLPVTLKKRATAHREPSVPTNVVVTGTTPDTISLSWDAPDNVDAIDKYHVRKYLGNDCGSKNLGMAETLTESVTITNAGLRLTPNTTYSFTVQARSNGIWGNESSCVSATTAIAVVPEAPQNVRSIQVSDRSIVIAWDKPLDNGSRITDYEARQYIDNRCATHLVTVQRGDTVKLRAGFTRLAAGTDYHFAVYAKNEAGWSDASDCVTVTTDKSKEVEREEEKQALIPTNVIVTDVTETSVSLSWDAPKDDSVTGYHVHTYLGGLCEGGSGFDEATDTEATVTSIGSKSLAPGTEYSFAVRARNSSVWSHHSDCVSATTEAIVEEPVDLPETGAPTAPSEVLLTSDAPGTMTVSWNIDASDNVTRSQVTLYADNTCSYPLQTRMVLGTEHTFTGLPSNTDGFHANVRSENQVSWGPVSDCVSATTEAIVEEPVDLPETGAPTAPSAVILTSDAPGTATVSWDIDRDDNVTRSQVTLYADNTCSYPLQTKMVLGTEHTFIGLPSNTDGFHANVRSENQVSWGPVSDCVSVATTVGQSDVDTPGDRTPETTIRADRVSFSTAVVTWDITGDTVRSRVSLYGDNACIYPLQHKDVIGMRHLFTNLQNSTGYYVNVRSENKAGIGTVSPCVAVPEFSSGGF